MGLKVNVFDSGLVSGPGHVVKKFVSGLVSGPVVNVFDSGLMRVGLDM